MWQIIKKIIIDLFCDDQGRVSLTDVFSAVSLLFWICGTLYLLLPLKTWAHYDTFANLAVTGGVLKGVKYVSNVYSSYKGRGGGGGVDG